MIIRPPYVVVVSAPCAGVGRSTLAGNLAVYLKGLAEDLPVAYVSFDAAAVDAMFALSGSTAGNLNDLQPDVPFQALLALGEFGVEFCHAGLQPTAVKSADWLRKGLAQADYDGILILDVRSAHPLSTAAIRAADLVLVPIRDPAMLGEVVGLRKQFLDGGGAAEQFCLLPSELGAEGRYRCPVDLAEFLRFAAAERGFQVLDESLLADDQVREQAAERAKPVLTRAPQSRLHVQLRQLAELILSRRRQQVDSTARIARWLNAGILPSRARRVALCCPLCQQGVLAAEVQYLESYPARRRLLLHRSCLAGLLKGTGTGAFHGSAGALLIRPGAAQGGSAEELRLQVVSAELELLNSELLVVAAHPAWEALIQCATGRCLAELYREILLVSQPLSVAEALSPEWYGTFVALRGRLRRLCQEEQIS